MIARKMECSREHAACACMRVWEWADDQTADGYINGGLTPADVSEVVGVPGIGEAMQAAGWLVADSKGLLIPNWGRWNSQSAKKRLQERDRKRRGRGADK